MKQTGVLNILCLTACTALLMNSAASAASFGGLTVTPRGPQSYDLETNTTKMPQGGTVTHAQHGLSMTASKLEMNASEKLLAWNAKLKTKQGNVLVAKKLTYLPLQGQVIATGVTYNDQNIKQLKANTLSLYLADQILVAHGKVQMQRPRMSAAQLVIDVKTLRSLIMGPYQVAARPKAVKGEAGQKRILGLKQLRLEKFVAGNAEGKRLVKYLR